MLEVSCLTKIYNKQMVLDNINLDVKRGEIFCLLGLNGIGKTTLIKSLLNLSKIEGSIKINGESNNVANTKKELSYLPENFCPNQVLTGFEFLNFFNSFTEDELFSMCDLLCFDKKMLKQKISQYSKGTKQKLGLITTFLNKNVNLFILDEPLNNLDQLAILSFEKLLKNKRSEQTIFFTTHILSIVELCDRVAILNNGKIIFLNTPIKLKEMYDEKTFEKAFLKALFFD